MKSSLKLPKKIKNAFEKAVKARKNAYAPYSNFLVGAGIITKSGKIYTGCNVENVSYGGTVCAERVAILKAVSEGEKQVEHVLVVTEGSRPAPPCAFCLQVMAEFCSPKTTIWIGKPTGIIKKFSFEELLPQPFDPSYLR